MPTSLGHLAPHSVIRLLRPFCDLAGTQHPAGLRAIIRDIDIDRHAGTATLHLEQEGAAPFDLSFLLKDPDGPGGHRLRDFFDVIGEQTPPSVLEAWLANPLPSSAPPSLPDEATYLPTVQTIISRAAARDFAAAEEAYRALYAIPGVFAWAMPIVADQLEAAASSFATRDHEPVFHWLWEKVIDSWYANASQATSGGEGTALMMDVNAAKGRYGAMTQRLR